MLNEQKQAIINRAVTRGLDPNVPLKPSGIDWLGDIPEHWEVKPTASGLLACNVCYRIDRARLTLRYRYSVRVILAVANYDDVAQTESRALDAGSDCHRDAMISTDAATYLGADFWPTQMTIAAFVTDFTR